MAFEEYGKIDTLFDRDPETFVVDHTKLRNPVYGIIKTWVVTEKIDGTNIRICIDEENVVHIGGRTGKAQIPAPLAAELYRTFTPELMSQIRLDPEDTTPYTLYGEGYGAGIQKGGGYRPTPGFILFDVKVGDRLFLSDENVTDVAQRLGIERVPVLGYEMSLDAIITLCRQGFQSTLPGATCQAEGVVARPIMPLYDQRGNRLILKLKTKDFVSGKR